MKAKLLYEKKEQIEDICFFFLCTEFYCRVFLIMLPAAAQQAINMGVNMLDTIMRGIFVGLVLYALGRTTVICLRIDFAIKSFWCVSRLKS